MNKNLVLLSYGGETEYKRALFCIHSFFAWNFDSENVRIIVYTDLPSFFVEYIDNPSVEYILLTPELSIELQRNTDYIHLKKVGVIEMTFQKYPNDDLCFIDTDTFFIQNPAHIFNNFESRKSFLHKKEYQLCDAVEQFSSFGQGHFPQSFMNFISGKKFIVGGEEVIFDGTYFSWNTGVLALNKDFANLMDDVTDLTIQFHENSRWFVSEQLAFSLVLQKVTEIRSAENIVCHYWGKRQKVMMDIFLTKLFRDKSELAQYFINFNENSKKLLIRIENDLSLEQIKIAKVQNNYFYAFKQILKLFLRRPFQKDIYKQIYQEIV
ncbi:hypothetical protein [Pedobacter sp. Leaf132]|uniref:hypothetical protein n=1 Tax=Pedobacter sp. Leaf132 TaxID=2876557 RepID=UPI001E54EE5A|nr:hypothetical protein [Pedobacter sp. Leaf132]